MQAKTESAVVAEFRSLPEAEGAIEELVANAFSGEHIHVTSDMTQARAPADMPLPHSAARYEKDLRHWLESMFGQTADTEQPKYENAVHAGSVLVGVSTPEQMLDKAADILTHYSPLHVYRMVVVQVSEVLTLPEKRADEFLAISSDASSLRSHRTL